MTWAPTNNDAAISPTLAARPSMLSRKLKALVSPTIHTTVIPAHDPAVLP